MGESRFQLTACLFRSFALGQVEDKHNGLVAAFPEQGAAKKHGNAAAIFTKILLFKWLNDAG